MKETISSNQGISLLTMFLMGSTLILGAGGEAKQDAWLAVILAILFSLPIIWVYARFQTLYPGKDIFNISVNLFGNFLGKIITLLFTWYAFHLGSLVLRNFSEFISVVGLPETPEFVPTLVLSILCIWAVKEGIELVGRWAQFFLPILLIIIVVVVTLTLSNAEINNLRPFLYDGLSPVISGAFSIFAFPFAETVVFLMVFDSLKGNNPSKVYLKGLIFGAIIILVISTRNILVLGSEFASTLYFPSYSAVSLINVGDFIQRIESSVAVVFIFAGFVKICICMLAATKGTAKLFNIGDYRPLVAPVALLMVLLSRIIYENIMEMQIWAFDIYKFYAFPFQVILPIGILIVAEIKVRVKKKNR